MLLSFRIGNFRSFSESQELSLIASSMKDLMENTVEREVKNKKIRLLKGCALLGPNASGKSNLINALFTMQYLVEKSFALSEQKQRLPIHSFRLDSKYINEPSEFEVSFIKGDTVYHFGFTATQSEIYEEWLHAYPHGRKQVWYDRSGEEIYWGPNCGLDSLRKNAIEESTRTNVLLLSTAAQFNIKKYLDPFDWFAEDLCVIIETKTFDHEASYTVSGCKNSEVKTRVSRMMQAADFGIDSIEIEDKEVPISELDEMNVVGEIPENLDASSQGILLLPVFMHKTRDSDQLVKFYIDQESDGTKKFFELSGPILNILDTGRILVIDELDSSIHPSLVRFIVGLFNSAETNPNNAQLIFSSHAYTLLADRNLRRDQVYFFEKNIYGASKILSLADYKARKKEAILNGYLHGRYGSLPMIDENNITIEKNKNE